MGLLRWSIAMMCAFALAACGEEPATVEARQPAPGETVAEQPVAGPERRILAFGDSLFAAYGLDEDQGYPAMLEDALRERGINARVIDAGISGDTTAAGRQRLAFTLDAQKSPPDLVIVELGGNDLLRGLPVGETRANLDAMLAELRERGLPVLVMGMRAPPNLGADFQRDFDGLYTDLADQYDVDLLPFFLEPVYDQPRLIQPDRVHPTAAGIEALVDHSVDAVIEALPPPDDG